jgi:hypothetical protein
VPIWRGVPGAHPAGSITYCTDSVNCCWHLQYVLSS